MNRVVGVIPAKGSSSRIPEKNRQKILNVPLVLWACNNLNRILPKSDIYVDSDSAETRRLVEAEGFRTLSRPLEMATNATDGNALMRWEASQVEADIVIQHLPPMVFLKESTIKRAVEMVSSGEWDSVFGAAEEAFYLWDENGPKYDLTNIPNSFTLPKLLIEGMGLYVTRKEVLLRTGVRVGGKAAPVYLDKFEKVDIDYPEDLEYARILACGLPRGNPYTAGIEGLRGPKHIKLLVIDVDGTMTDGGMYLCSDGLELKKFNTKDGLGIKKALDKGLEVVFLSSAAFREVVEHRAKMLGVRHVSVSLEPKLERLRNIAAQLGIDLKDTAFIGDDINDLDAMRACGWTACPKDAAPEVLAYVDEVLTLPGGAGCIREFTDKHLTQPRRPA